MGACNVPWRILITVLVLLVGSVWLLEWLCCEGPEGDRARRRLIGLVLGYISVHVFVW